MDRFLKRPREDEQDAQETPNKSNKDLESTIVDYVLEHADYGERGRINTRGPKRKILQMGKQYYWKNKALPFESLPSCFEEFATKHGVKDFNSILCNVYMERQSRIGLHSDNTSLLKPNQGTVKSISLAIHARDRDRRLAVMMFQARDGSVETHDLLHNTCITFDAHQDGNSGRKHEVKKTEYPRLNLTYRHLK